MKPEAKVLSAIVRHLKAIRKRGEPIFFYKTHGGPMQRAGIPDLCIVYRGQTLFVEVKAPGKKATPIQQFVMNEIYDAGGMTGVVDSLESFIELLG